MKFLQMKNKENQSEMIEMNKSLYSERKEKQIERLKVLILAL